MDERNKNCRTRRQKQKNLEFSFKMIHSNHDQPMDIDNISYSIGSSTEYGEPMKCSSPQACGIVSMELESNDMSPIHMVESVLEPPIVPEIPDTVELQNADEPAEYIVPVRFFDAVSKRELWAKQFARNKPIDKVMGEFARANNLNLNNLVFSDQKNGLLEANQRPLELLLDCDQTEMNIYVEVETQKRTSVKRSISINRPTNANQRPKLQYYLTFKDQTAKRDPIDINFTGEETLSFAVGQIVETMELDRSKTHFFNSKGTI